MVHAQELAQECKKHASLQLLCGNEAHGPKRSQVSTSYEFANFFCFLSLDTFVRVHIYSTSFEMNETERPTSRSNSMGKNYNRNL